ncbi:MAG: hypothetical protein FJ144_04770 [Deltaproteobacteria bacterium]|nr:hypothetical protein [Deltaproteobacteria bacterium]
MARLDSRRRRAARRVLLRRFVLTLALLVAAPAAAVSPVFDPAGTSFYDLPFPYELRRDPDGTVALASFPRPSALVDQYIDTIDQIPGFGQSAGVFFKLDGDLDPATLPPTAADSIEPSSSVFLIDIDPMSKNRGRRIPLWTEFRSVGDAYRDDHLLAMMPVPGHLMDADTLYAAVLLDGLVDDGALPLVASPFIGRMIAETPQSVFEGRSQPLYRALWNQLERHEGIDRSRVVGATVFRTGTPLDGLLATEKWLRHRGPIRTKSITLDVARSAGSMWVFTGQFDAPQFQNGTPPFNASTGAFVFDDAGRPVQQRTETLTFVLTIPKEKADGTVKMPRRGWPIAQYMHGTGGSRFSAYNGGTAQLAAGVGVAMLAIDQPLHGLRAGATADGSNFYNPLRPLALRDNPRQAAADSLAVHQLLRSLRVDDALVTIPPGSGFAAPKMDFKFDDDKRLYMGHSQGATTGPLFLGVARSVPGAILSAGGGHLLVNILTREETFFAGLKLRDLAAILLGTDVDLFHPGLHLLQMGSELSDPILFAPEFGKGKGGRPQSILFTHGLEDGYVTTPMTTAMVVAAGYPLVAPTFPPLSFDYLPGYSYQEAFDLAGLPTLVPPVAGNLSYRSRTGTGGLVHFENEGHFPVFDNPDAIAQWTEFLRTLAYEELATIPAR